MRNTLPFTFCLIVILSAAFAGCIRDKTMPPGEVRTDPISKTAYPQQVALERLESYVVSGDPTVLASTEHPLSVEVPLRAISNQPLNVQYRFLFFDGQGRLLRPEPDWRFTTLNRAQQYVRGSALDTNAMDWRLEVRPAR